VSYLERGFPLAKLTSPRPGAFLISFGLPILTYVFAYACNDVSGCPAPSLLSPTTLSWSQLKSEIGWPQEGVAGLFSWEAVAAVLGYLLVNAILYRILPAVEVEGTLLRSGGRLKYRFNSTPAPFLAPESALT
jgi:delta14-sterol reductase